MPLGDLARMVWYTRFGDQAGLLVWHAYFETLVGAELTNPQRAENWYNAAKIQLSGALSTAAEVRGVGWRLISPGQSVESFSISPAVPGQAPGEPLPRQTAGVVTLRTPFAGRANRGRKYMPFPSETDNTTGIQPTAGYLAVVNTFIAMHVPTITLLAGPTTEVWRSCLPRPNQVPKGINFTSFLTRDAWGTQRRRGTFGRPNVLPV